MMAVGILAVGCTGMPTPLPEAGSAGARLYESKCGECHSVPHPRRYRPGQWEQTMKNMTREMELKGVTPLTKAEEVVILDYLTSHSR